MVLAELGEGGELGGNSSKERECQPVSDRGCRAEEPGDWTESSQRARPVWLSALGVAPSPERAPARFPVRARPRLWAGSPGIVRRQAIDVSLSHQCFYLSPFPFKKSMKTYLEKENTPEGSTQTHEAEGRTGDLELLQQWSSNVRVHPGMSHPQLKEWGT